MVRSDRFVARVVIETAIVFMSAALVVCALSADQQWLDRHVLPGFYLSRHSYVLIQWIIRLAMTAFGGALALLARQRIARFIVSNPARTLHAAVAVVLAFGASELILRQLHFRATQEQPPTQEPRRRLDARLGWTIVPSRAGHHVKGGRDIVYAFDSAGYRVRRMDEPVNPDRPTIVFTGESMMLGEGLRWDETIPAQTGTIMGIQSANLAVSGFANDQAYLRLASELPRFRRPVAVVSLFMPALFDRNLDDDRPHLGPGLVWLPAERRWRLAAILKRLIDYRGTDTIERGITATRDVLSATVELARARGAVPIIVVPQFGEEEPEERALRRRVLDEAGLPYVSVEIDARWRIPADSHPNPLAAHAIAVAIAARLREH